MKYTADFGYDSFVFHLNLARPETPVVVEYEGQYISVPFQAADMRDQWDAALQIASYIGPLDWPGERLRVIESESTDV